MSEIAGKVRKIFTEIFKTTEGGNGLSDENVLNTKLSG